MNLYFARPSFSVKLFTLSSWPNKDSLNKVCEKYSNGYLPRNSGSLDNLSRQLWGETAKRPRENWRIWFSLFSLFLPLTLISYFYSNSLSYLFFLQTTLISFLNIFPSLRLSQWEKSPSTSFAKFCRRQKSKENEKATCSCNASQPPIFDPQCCRLFL